MESKIYASGLPCFYEKNSANVQDFGKVLKQWAGKAQSTEKGDNDDA